MTHQNTNKLTLLILAFQAPGATRMCCNLNMVAIVGTAGHIAQLSSSENVSSVTKTLYECITLRMSILILSESLLFLDVFLM